MSSLIDMISRAIGDTDVSSLSKQLGTDEGTAKGAVGAGLATILGAIQRNASQPQGAESLSRALQKHDGSALGNITGMLSNTDTEKDGDGILKHVFGARRGAVEQSLSKSTGMDAGSVDTMLKKLAPMVMGALGKQQRESGLNANALAGFLGEQRQAAEKAAPAEMGAIGRLLDADGDGDVDLGDLAKAGLGKLLGR